MSQFIRSIATIMLCSLAVLCFAQPANDKCANATTIVLSNSGFGDGIFISSKSDLTKATREIGEQCSEDLSKLGNCAKTVWFSFYIPTCRNIEIFLKQQDSAIPQIFAGFTVYKAPDCNYSMSDLAKQLTPVAKFGSSGNACLNEGTYYIQVSAKQKAEGEIWLELVSKTSTAEIYDNQNTPYELILKNNEYKYQYFDIRCYSITEDEKIGINDPLYFKSLWINVSYENAAFYRMIRGINSDSRKAAKYRVFYGPPTIDSIKSNKPFQSTQNQYGFIIFDETCEASRFDTSIFVQIIFPEGVEQFSIGASLYTDVPDTWNNPATPYTVKLTKNMYVSTTKYFNCSGLLANYSCAPALQDSFVFDYSWTSDSDTSYYGAYMVLKPDSAGTLNLGIQDGYRSENYITHIRLYKGDISKSCDLQFVMEATGMSSFGACLEDSVYTLVLFRPKNIANSNKIELLIRFQDAPSVDVRYFRHTDVNDIGTVRPSVNINPIYSPSINIHHTDTSFTIGSQILKGRFIFHEFNVAETTQLNIGTNNNNSGIFKYYLLKGRISDNSLQEISYFGKTELSNYEFNNSCYTFTPGYYSIIAHYDTGFQTPYNRYTPCRVPKNFIVISLKTYCTQQQSNYDYKNATAINNNQNLTSNSAVKVGIKYVYNFTSCVDCKSASPLKPVLPKEGYCFVKVNELFYYYTFYIEENTEISLVGSNYLLYAGDVTQNPSLVSDTLNIIQPCKGNVFCNLKGKQKYTIVLFGNNGYNFNLVTITAVPPAPSPNNYLDKSDDIGHLSNNTPSYSSYCPITCQTTYSLTDPFVDNNGTFRDVNEYYLPIPNHTKQNIASPFSEGNIWFTFTVSDASDIKVDLDNGMSKCNERILIFRYKNDYQQVFANALANGWDSVAANFEFIIQNSRDYSGRDYSNSVIFKNAGCTNNRYFVCITGSQVSTRLKVVKTPLPSYNNLGDFCNNAIATTHSAYGDFTTSVNNTCHTFGMSPFEPSNKNELKTTWFEIKIDNLKKCDLRIKYSGAQTIVGYNVYAGSCGVLTKVAQLTDMYSYFSLSCMGSGSYYIQAFTKNTVNGMLKFSYSLEKSENENCKPYDFKNPIAQFDIDRGCNSDSFYCYNLSTQGDAIKYYWFLNNTLIDSSLNLGLLKSDIRLFTDNKISLIVLNTIDKIADTLTQNYINDTTKYFIKINELGIYRCHDTVQLYTQTNYPHKMNYSWTASNYNMAFSAPSKQNTQVTKIAKGEIMIKATSDYCLFYDTVVIGLDNSSGVFKDTIICPGETSIVYSTFGIYSMVLNGMYMPNNSKLTISDSGLYTMRYYSQGCYYYDTFLIEKTDEIKEEHYYDSLSLCNSEIKTLSYSKKLLSYNWSTGEKTSSIAVSNAGKYILQGARSSCVNTTYEVEVTKDSFPKFFLRDTVICQNTLFRFVNPRPEYEVNYVNIGTQEFRIVDDMVLIVSLGNNACKVSDTSKIKTIKNPNLSFSYDFCIGRDTLILDAQNALEYNWLDENEIGRYLYANAYKKYVVVRKNLNNCFDSISFLVTEDCPNNVFIPNAFTPDFNNLNSSFGPIISGEYNNYEMQIFNRWGEKIYETNQSKPWDGHYLGKRVQQGVYLVLLNIDIKGKRSSYSFSITVLY